MVHSGLGPIPGRVPLPSTEIISGGERFDPKNKGGGTAFPCIPFLHSNYCINLQNTGSVAIYAIRPGNEVGLFFKLGTQHGEATYTQ